MQITEPPIPVLSEKEWIENESRRPVLAVGLESLSMNAVVMAVIFVALYGHAETSTLMIWYGFSVFVCLLRLYLLMVYRTSQKKGQQAAQNRYFSLYAQVFFLTGLSTGTLVYLFSDRVPDDLKYLCIVTVVATGILSMTYLTSHLPSWRRFFSGYAIGLIVAEIAKVSFKPDFQITTTYTISCIFLVLFLGTLFRSGRRMHSASNKSLTAQYHNTQLIASLTLQTKTALSAIATKNRFLASAAHDMRQPVLALDLYAEWLVKDPELSPLLSPKIAEATKAVTSLFDSLFDMARLAEGRMTVQLVRINIHVLVEELSLQFRPMAQTKGLELRTRYSDGEIWTDPILLKRIISNLISNAIKYTDTGGILLACRNTRQGLRMEVWDTGLGIAPEQQDLVFKEFYKNPANVGTSDGFGLGLAIVTQLSELLDYKMTMTSRPSRGTMVSLQLGHLIVDDPF